MTQLLDLPTPDTYKYHEGSVATLLMDYETLKTMGTYSYDVSAPDICLDLERSLTSTLITPDSREAAALIYGLQLSFVQASKITGRKASVLKENLQDLCEVVEATLNGFHTMYKTTTPSKAKTVSEWLKEVHAGDTFLYDIPTGVHESLLTFLADNRDKLAQSTLEQKENEQPEVEPVAYEPDDYPFHETSEKIESPNRKAASKNNRYDYFREKDLDHNVAAVDFSRIAKGMHPTGRKANRCKTSDVISDVKQESKRMGLIY